MRSISGKLPSKKNISVYSFIPVLIIAIILIPNCIYSQNKVRDTMLLKVHSPTKATIMSAILPGLGQAYNKKYWKIPILYAGAGAIYYFVESNNKEYKYWKKEYKNEMELRKMQGYDANKDKYAYYTEQDFITLRDYYRRNLELTYIIGGAVYLLNILDAAVDANLYNYNINDDLSLRVTPIFSPTYDRNVNFAMSITLKF